MQHALEDLTEGTQVDVIQDSVPDGPGKKQKDTQEASDAPQSEPEDVEQKRKDKEAEKLMQEENRREMAAELKMISAHSFSMSSSSSFAKHHGLGLVFDPNGMACGEAESRQHLNSQRLWR